VQTDLIRLLEAHVPRDDTERRHLAHTLDFVGRTPACTSRLTLEGHVTASAWILSPDRRAALLTHHRKLDRWLQPGGHVEDDPSIQAAAVREAREESGILALALADPAIFDVDVHLIPARKGEPDHFHFDLRFLIHSGTRDFAVGEESIDLAWVELASLARDETDPSILRMVRKSLSTAVRAG